MRRFLIAVLISCLLVCVATDANSLSWPATAKAVSQEAVLSPVPSWTFDDREQIGAEVGISVDGAGDINGDGYDDVIIGADKYTLNVDVEGVALVFYGSPGGLAPVPDWSMGGGLKAARFGCAVSTGGDINADGYADVIVGANRWNHDQPEEGAIFVYLGSRHGLGDSPDWMYESNQKSAQLGISVGNSGDVNGDGFDDVIAGALLFTDVITNVNQGGAFVFYGSATGLPDTPNWIALGGLSSSQFGASVSSAGDLNGDGYDDVIIGAPQYAGKGQARVFFGSAGGLQDQPGWSKLGEMEGDAFGAAVAGAGDVNHDGYSDVVIGAPHAGTLQFEDVGAAYLYLGSAQGLSLDPAWQVFGSHEYGMFGAALAGVGDLDRDGFDDVVVGAPLFDANQPDEGAMFAYLGRPTGLLFSPGWSTFGDKADATFAASVGGAGDVNRDGWPDLIAGAPQYRLDTLIVGRSMAFYGGDVELLTYLPLLLQGP